MHVPGARTTGVKQNITHYLNFPSCNIHSYDLAQQKTLSVSDDEKWEGLSHPRTPPPKGGKGSGEFGPFSWFLGVR